MIGAGLREEDQTLGTAKLRKILSRTIASHQILFSMLICVCLSSSVKWRPFRLVLEQSHSLRILFAISSSATASCVSLGIVATHVVGVRRESVVDASWHDHQVAFLKLNADPVIILVPHIEISTTVEDIPNLFVLMQVLMEEGFDFAFISISKGGWRDGDLIPVLVSPLCSKIVDLGR